VDMDTLGITCTPIRDVTGQGNFCEVVFHEARVPVANRLGGEGDGWQVAMGTLAHERVGTGGIAIGLRAELAQMVQAARDHNPDALADPGIRERIARLYAQIELTRLLNARALSKVLKGERSWPEAQLAKLQWSHLSQALAELNVDMLGPLGVLAKGGPDTPDGGHAVHNYPWQRYTSIGAGAPRCRRTSSPTGRSAYPAGKGISSRIWPSGSRTRMARPLTSVSASTSPPRSRTRTQVAATSGTENDRWVRPGSVNERSRAGALPSRAKWSSSRTKSPSVR